MLVCPAETSMMSAPAFANIRAIITASDAVTPASPTQSSAEILTDIIDVTDRVLAAGAGLEGAAFVQARGAATTAIEDENCTSKETQTCQVISFYRGGRYALCTMCIGVGQGIAMVIERV